METISPVVQKAVQEHLYLLDLVLPNRISGYYLVGSIALNDYREGLSDIDFVCITESGLEKKELVELKKIHKRLSRMKDYPSFDGIYVSREQAGNIPESRNVPYVLDNQFHETNGFAANPVTWYMLKEKNVAFRVIPDLFVHHSDSELRKWCIDNLNTYWKNWIKNSIGNPVSRFMLLFASSVQWGVSGIVRLHATIAFSEVISKSDVLEYASVHFPEKWHGIIREAFRIRHREKSSYRNVFARRKDAIAFMKFVFEESMASDRYLNQT